MKKSDRVEEFLDQLAPSDSQDGLSPHYTGFFTCFNKGQYYEAHDVLEHLWLRCADNNRMFYKGLIQLAGGFVHMRLQFLHPAHRIHGRRLAPASRLLRLASANIAPYPAHHLQLHTTAVTQLCESYIHRLTASNTPPNPWSPETRPSIRLEKAA